MITSGYLVQEVADVLGVPETVVATYYRRLREEGLVPKAGRGPKSAIAMTPRIAALLLTTIGGRMLENGSVGDVARTYSALKATESTRITRTTFLEGEDQQHKDSAARGSGEFEFEGVGIPSLDALGPGHSFVQAIEAIIEAELNDEFISFQNKEPRKVKDFSYRNIEIEFFSPIAMAQIQIYFSFSEEKSCFFEVIYFGKEAFSKKISESKLYSESTKTLSPIDYVHRYSFKDLLMTRKISGSTIKRVAGLFWNDFFDSLSEEEQSALREDLRNT
ncbi:hypothetical protein [Martelella radicis]|uniref:Uncharacterized protein n=1 Tax=Martelella radicis TaxID=1397476 RepID=A0A7W6KNE3_9HYPH|nr:hypothetical protein [Martelella radicis]MBB4123274.1 hypothetical protein [Martelella radicis]